MRADARVDPCAILKTRETPAWSAFCPERGREGAPNGKKKCFIWGFTTKPTAVDSTACSEAPAVREVGQTKSASLRLGCSGVQG